MTKTERAHLMAILTKIHENTLDAWEHNMEGTKTVVALENFNKLNPEEAELHDDNNEGTPTEYNGWYEDLCKVLGVLPYYPQYTVVPKEGYEWNEDHTVIVASKG